jgi:protein TonB
MLFNLTDLIFENRNKLYGAYRLRKNYFYALTIGLLCNIPFVVGCIIWIKHEQRNMATPSNEAYQEREIMLQVDENVDIVDISELPVLTESNPNTSFPKTEEVLQVADREESTNPEIKVTDSGENKENPKDNQDNNTSPKDTTQLSPLKSSEKPSITYNPDVWSVYVKQNLQYPPQALRDKKECNVFVAVVIKEDGSLELDKERALYGCEEYFNEEVKRLIANAPRFIPAIDANGKPKNKINLKISFKLP